MSWLRVLELVASALLAGLFWAGVRLSGRAVLRLAGWRVADRVAGEIVLGLCGCVVVVSVIGALGWLWWPVAAVVGVLPGIAGLVTALVRRRLIVGREIGPAPDIWDRLVAVGVFVAAVPYAVVSWAPATHYDLMVNYLAVAKAFLLSGSLAPQAENVFSTLAFGLHALVAMPLALSEVVDLSPFVCGGAEVYGFVTLAAVGAAAFTGVRLAAQLGDNRPGARRAGWIAVMLWLALPQNLLVMGLELPDALTSCLVLCLASTMVEPRRGSTADAVIAGVACGLLAACKPQTAGPALVVGVYWFVRSRFGPQMFAFGIAAFAAWLPAGVRAWVFLGHPLAPWFGGSDAVAGVIAENAVAWPAGIAELGARLWALVSQQPETGVVMLSLLVLPVAARRAPWLVALGAVPPVLLSFASGSAHNVLRWCQGPLLVLLVLAAVVLEDTARRVPVVRAVPLVLAALSVAVGVRFVDATLGFGRGLRPAEDVVRDVVPTYDLRRQLLLEDGRVLWVGEVQGYWGAENGLFPTVRNGSFLREFVDAADPVAALAGSGITTVVRSRFWEPMLEEQGFWSDVGGGAEAGRAKVERMLSRLDLVEQTPIVSVYRVPTR